MKKTTTITTAKISTLNSNKKVSMNKTVAEKKTHYEPAPLTDAEHADIQERLMKHRLCIKSGKKHARVYRFKGYKDHKMITSPDFVYVIQADDYRANPDATIAEVVKKSAQVMTKRDKKIKNDEYERNMVRVEEDLLMNKGIVMQWKVAKHVIFRKINHICTDRAILAELDEYAKDNGPFVTNRLRATKDGKHLEIFRKLVRIFEETEKNVPDYDWKSFRYITKNGQVVCAYSRVDEVKMKKISFERGVTDKFGYNLNINDNIDEILAKIAK
jgi:hypothetical protein